jgi:hypothetical protein
MDLTHPTRRRPCKGFCQRKDRKLATPRHGASNMACSGISFAVLHACWQPEQLFRFLALPTGPFDRLRARPRFTSDGTILHGKTRAVRLACALPITPCKPTLPTSHVSVLGTGLSTACHAGLVAVMGHVRRHMSTQHELAARSSSGTPGLRPSELAGIVRPWRVRRKPQRCILVQDATSCTRPLPCCKLRLRSPAFWKKAAAVAVGGSSLVRRAAMASGPLDSPDFIGIVPLELKNIILDGAHNALRCSPLFHSCVSMGASLNAG